MATPRIALAGFLLFCLSATCFAADAERAKAAVGIVDADGDGVADVDDNCLNVANAGQADDDGDGAGDACDNCQGLSNPDQANSDTDPFGDACVNCDFVARKENVILIGQPGTGKTHLAIALGMKACEAGHRVRFSTIQDLAATLRSALADATLEDRIADFVDPDLVILDELGFTPLDREVADVFYRIIASRYERSSIIITSNKSFESWAAVFPDAVIASAVLDRLVHHAHLVPIVGDSYRMKELKTPKPKGGANRKASTSV